MEGLTSGKAARQGQSRYTADLADPARHRAPFLRDLRTVVRRSTAGHTLPAMRGEEAVSPAVRYPGRGGREWHHETTPRHVKLPYNRVTDERGHAWLAPLRRRRKGLVSRCLLCYARAGSDLASVPCPGRPSAIIIDQRLTPCA